MFDWLSSAGDWLSGLGSDIGDWFSGGIGGTSGGIDLGSFGGSSGLDIGSLGDFSGGASGFDWTSNTPWAAGIDTGLGTSFDIPTTSFLSDYANNVSSIMPGEWDWMKGGKIGGLQVPGLVEGGLGLAKYLMNRGDASQTRSTGQQAATAADPFASQRALYQQKLWELYNNPNALQSVPGYQTGLNTGLDQIRRNAAKSGRLDSGNINYDILDYSTKYALDQYNEQAKQLAGLSGANIGNTGAAAQALMQSNQDAQKLSAYGLQALADPWKTANASGTLADQLSKYMQQQSTGATF